MNALKEKLAIEERDPETGGILGYYNRGMTMFYEVFYNKDKTRVLIKTKETIEEWSVINGKFLNLYTIKQV